MKPADVLLDRDVDPAGREGPRPDAGLDPLADLPVLAVDPIEERHRVGRVEAGPRDRVRIEEPVARHARAIRRERRERVHDHVVGEEVQEHVRADHHPVVVPLVAGGEARERRGGRPPAHRERLRVVGQARAEPVLLRRAAPEGRQEPHQLRVHRRAVVALHEVLDDDLPVRPHLVLEGPGDREGAHPVRGQTPGVAEPVGELREDLVGDGRGVRRQAHPDEPLPRVERHGDEPERAAVEIRRILEPRGPQEAAVEPVGPRVIATLEGARLTVLGRAELGAAVATDVEEGPKHTVLTPARRERSRRRHGRCGRRPDAGNWSARPTATQRRPNRRSCSSCQIAGSW